MTKEEKYNFNHPDGSLAGKEKEDYLFKLAEKVIWFFEVKCTKEEVADLVMSDLININIK